MLITKRRGVFETNSSMTHSCTIMPKEVYNEWKKTDDLYFFDGYFDPSCFPDGYKNVPVKNHLYTLDEVLDIFKNYKYTKDDKFGQGDFEEACDCYGFLSKEMFWDDEYRYKDTEEYTTPCGEELVLLYKYGCDG